MPKRIYCIDTNSSVIDIFKLTAEQRRGPPVCFITNSIKSSVIILYYPVVAQMQRDKSMTPDQSRKNQYRYPYKSCSCSASGVQEGSRDYYYLCERVDFATGFFYSKNFNLTYQLQQKGMITTHGPWREIIQFGLEQQQVVIANRASDDGDIKLMDKFVPVFGAVALVANNPSLANTPLSKPWVGNKTANQLLAEAFTKTAGPSIGLVMFESLSILGDINVDMPLNTDSIELRTLLELQGDSHPQYFDWMIRANMTSLMCQDPFTQSAAFSALAATPPVELIERYFSCSKTVKYAMETTLGNAISMSNFIVTLIWLALGAVIVMILRLHAEHRGRPDVYVSDKRIELMTQILEEMKDETLCAALSNVHKRLQSLEKQKDRSAPTRPRTSHPTMPAEEADEADEMEAKTATYTPIFAAFRRCRLHDLKAVRGKREVGSSCDYRAVGTKMSRRLWELMEGDSISDREVRRLSRLSTLTLQTTRQSDEEGEKDTRSRHSLSVLELVAQEQPVLSPLDNRASMHASRGSHHHHHHHHSHRDSRDNGKDKSSDHHHSHRDSHNNERDKSSDGRERSHEIETRRL